MDPNSSSLDMEINYLVVLNALQLIHDNLSARIKQDANSKFDDMEKFIEKYKELKVRQFPCKASQDFYLEVNDHLDLPTDSKIMPTHQKDRKFSKLKTLKIVSD